MKNKQLYLTHLISGCDSHDNRAASLRNYYIFHYVLEGEGHLQLEDKLFSVAAGQTFYIPPGVRVSYWASDSKAGWKYYWVNFSGEQAKILLENTAFSVDNPVCRTEESPIGLYRSITECPFDTAGRCLADSLVMQLISFYIRSFPSENTLRREHSIRPLFSFIRNNLYRPELNVDYIANALNISRVTLYRKFLEETGRSPSQYIKSRRLIRAAQMLTSTDLSVSQIAYSVGYNDPLYFSKLFREQYHQSPTAFRKSAAK